MSIKQIIPADRWYAEYRYSKPAPGQSPWHQLPVACFGLDSEGNIFPLVWDVETGDVVIAENLEGFQKIGRYDE